MGTKVLYFYKESWHIFPFEQPEKETEKYCLQQKSTSAPF